mmetsp:Transcript_48619/g.109133  ORF Transcript_48619/g.109133 Transcript_48619/m.109133 type:complete len:317 (-) Transcript_48619:699-1649(-)
MRSSCCSSPSSAVTTCNRAPLSVSSFLMDSPPFPISRPTKSDATGSRLRTSPGRSLIGARPPSRGAKPPLCSSSHCLTNASALDTSAASPLILSLCIAGRVDFVEVLALRFRRPWSLSARVAGRNERRPFLARKSAGPASCDTSSKPSETASRTVLTSASVAKMHTAVEPLSMSSMPLQDGNPLTRSSSLRWRGSSPSTPSTTSASGLKGALGCSACLNFRYPLQARHSPGPHPLSQGTLSNPSSSPSSASAASSSELNMHKTSDLPRCLNPMKSGKSFAFRISWMCFRVSLSAPVIDMASGLGSISTSPSANFFK